jgi:hypothetical protein
MNKSLFSVVPQSCAQSVPPPLVGANDICIKERRTGEILCGERVPR